MANSTPQTPSQNVGMSGHNFDAFVNSQRTFNDYDIAARIQETYYRARQKCLSKIEKKEDSCIVLSDSKLDTKLEVYHSIDKSCAKLIDIVGNYQNALFQYANEENSLGILLKECGKQDKTKAGKILTVTGKSLTQSSHQRIRLYMPLLRFYQEMETFHSRAVEDTSETVDKLESKRSQYRASLLWMKDISEKLNPDDYRQLDKFRRVQNQVRNDKKVFDGFQMDVVQKIDLLMASRCNLINQVLASYQATMLETLERNYNNFKSVEELIKKEDIHEYEFKVLKELNPLKVDSESNSPTETQTTSPIAAKKSTDENSREQEVGDLLLQAGGFGDVSEQKNDDATLIDLTGGGSPVNEPLESSVESEAKEIDPEDLIIQIQNLFGHKEDGDPILADFEGCFKERDK